jgi:hypothetical protein
MQTATLKYGNCNQLIVRVHEQTFNAHESTVFLTFVINKYAALT